VPWCRRSRRARPQRPPGLRRKGAGDGSGFDDAAYKAAGAKVVPECRSLRGRRDDRQGQGALEAEFPLIHRNHIVFTYFHFAASRTLTDAMMRSGAACIAYETVERADVRCRCWSDERGRRPHGRPGRAKYLEKPMEGRGILLAGIPAWRRPPSS